MALFKYIREQDLIARELFQPTSRKVILTTVAIYLFLHFAATLAWPAVFSPSLWLTSLLMIIVTVVTMRLIGRYFLLAQGIWFTGLTGVILQAYSVFGRPEILLLLALLPMMAEVMLGLRGALVILVGLVALVFSLPGFPVLPPLPPGYTEAVCLSILASAVLGWGLSDNLLSALETSSFHYQDAMDKLDEARRHRAEISKLLTEQNKMNYQLNRLNRMLAYARARADEARADRDRFTMAVSHELRSPLNYIIGFSDLMVNSPETYAPLARWPSGLYADIQEIYKSSTHLNGLINDILEMGKIDAQQMLLFKEKAQLPAIARDVCEMIEPSVHQKGLWLQLEAEPDLPEVFIDCTRIRQVLLNLVTNSMRFTSKGGITIRLSRRSQDAILVQVVDTGTGISKEDLSKLFKEFRQVGKDSYRRSEGTGLGLSIGKRFVELHGGEIGAESEVGKGSTFYFTIPLSPADEPAVQDAYPEEVSFHVRRDREQLLVFLCEEPYWAKVMADSIENYTVSILSDPEKLYTTVSQTFPRALLVDLALLDHPAVQAFLQNPPYDLPILRLPVPRIYTKASDLPRGVSHYLVKPVSRQVLVETLGELSPGVRNLLVVDDDPSMVRYLTQALGSPAGESNGRQASPYHFITALNAAEALEALRGGTVDAILLDLDLPDIDGLTLLEQVRQDDRWETLPVIIISANDISQVFTEPQPGCVELSTRRAMGRHELAGIVESLLEKVGTIYAPVTPKPAETAAEEPPAASAG